jgi:hypothetical protein
VERADKKIAFPVLHLASGARSFWDHRDDSEGSVLKAQKKMVSLASVLIGW